MQLPSSMWLARLGVALSKKPALTHAPEVGLAMVTVNS